MRKRLLLALSALLLLGGTAFADGNVAMVGDTEYATIGEAISNWKKGTVGTTLTLLSNCTYETADTCVILGTKTLDLNSYKLTWTMTKTSTKKVGLLMLHRPL